MSDASRSAGIVASTEGKRILVVEDEPDIRRILQLFLTEKGFQVKVADQAFPNQARLFGTPGKGF